MKNPILIVGQGLAGTWLSFFLRKEGLDFRVIDHNHYRSSSAIAAGLINPIVPKRLTRTWMFEELFPEFISSTYRAMETLLGKNYFYPEKKIHKLFFHADDISAWEKARNSELATVLGEVYKEPLNAGLQPHLGYAAINYSAWVDIPLLIKDYGQQLKDEGLLLHEKLDYVDIEILTEGISHKGTVYSQIIFCEGFQNHQNPWFKHLPMYPTKGEELTIEAKGLNLSQTITSGLHIIPLGNDTYSVGSTFRWDDVGFSPTTSAKEDILNKLAKIYSGSFQIINHVAGIRPATKDRRPFVGFHPQYKQFGILNGLGTKGLILAPLMSKYLTENLVKGTEIPKECNINRFHS